MIKYKFFYLKKRGQIFGPFPAAKLLQMYKLGQLAVGDSLSPDKEHWSDVKSFFSPKTKPEETAWNTAKPFSLTPDNFRVIQDDAQTAVTDAEIPNDNITETMPIEEKKTWRVSPWMLCCVFGGFLLAVILFSAGLYFIMDATKDSASGQAEEKGNETPSSQSSVVPSHEESDHDSEKAQSTAATRRDEGLPPMQKQPMKFTTIAEKYKNAVGIVLFRVELTDGRIGGPFPVGTAWATGPDCFVTNAHVVLGVAEAVGQIQKLGKNYSFSVKNIQVLIGLNRSKKRLTVNSFQLPDKSGVKRGIDIGVLFVDEHVDTYFSCEHADLQRNLRQGEEIAFLGFPMEGLVGENINVESPVASMQIGNIVALTDVNNGDSGFPANYIVRHNLPTVGGASGSPIFMKNGMVVAILNAGNMEFKFNEKGEMISRQPSAAMINYAIRIDQLQECLSQPRHSIYELLGE